MVKKYLCLKHTKAATFKAERKDKAVQMKKHPIQALNKSKEKYWQKAPPKDNIEKHQ